MGSASIRLPCCRHIGRFVIAGGLTLADQHHDYFFGILRACFPDLLRLYEQMYPHPTASHGGIRSSDPHTIGRRDRDLCRQCGISDRMPRFHILYEQNAPKGP